MNIGSKLASYTYVASSATRLMAQLHFAACILPSCRRLLQACNAIAHLDYPGQVRS